MNLSVVSTLYNSSNTVEEFVRSMFAQLKENGFDQSKIILVDDGSKDDSLDKAKKLIPEFPQLEVIQLSRNFGHHQALREGLKYTNSDLVFMLDSDLEESPELLGRFISEMSEDKDSVIGVQSSRKGKVFERSSGGFFWKLFNRLSDTKIPSNVCTIRLMRQNVVSSILQYNETEFFFSGIAEHAGFSKKYIEIDKSSKGYSSYSLNKRLALMINAISSFSSKPLIYFVLFGLFISLISILSGVVLLIRRTVFEVEFQLGWSSLILSIWFLSGMIMSMLGVLGIYISKLFNEVKNRPSAIVKNIFKS